MQNTETGIQCPNTEKITTLILHVNLFIFVVTMMSLILASYYKIKNETLYTVMIFGLCLILTLTYGLWCNEKLQGRSEAFENGCSSALGIAWGIDELIPETIYEVELAVRKHKRVHLLIKKGLGEAPGKPVWCTISDTNFDTSLSQVQAHEIGKIRVWGASESEGGEVEKLVTAIRRPPPTIPAKMTARISLPPPSKP